MVPEIINEKEYMILQNDFDITYIFGKRANFSGALRAIMMGYSEEELKYCYQEELDELHRFMDRREFTLDEVLAIYKYTLEPDIFAMDKDYVEFAIIDAKHSLHIDLMREGPAEAVNEVIAKVVEIAKSNGTLLQRCEKLDDEIGMPLGLEYRRETLQYHLIKLDLIYNCEKLQKDLLSALTKTKIGFDLKLFKRTISIEDFNIEEFLNKDVTIDKVIMISELKDNSFKKTSSYGNMIVEFFVDQNVKGIHVDQIADLDSDGGALLYVHSIRIFDIADRGREKIVKCFVF